MENTQTISTEALIEHARSWNIGKWSTECRLLSSDQLAALVPLAISSLGEQTWKEKLHHLFTYLPSNVPNQNFGRALSSEQILEILHFVKNGKKEAHNLQKLSSLFMGVSPNVFHDILVQANTAELSFLREEAITESVQHNLSLIVNELHKRFIGLCDELATKGLEIEGTDLQTIGKDEIASFYESVKNYQEGGDSILFLTGRALSIAWNSNRVDLIQELGRIKELCQKCMNESVGKTGIAELAPTGLFHLLNKKVDRLFSDMDTNGNLTLMKNTTPALEALVKLSVWYIQDYCDVGLLPQVKPVNDMNTAQENEDLKKREQLFIAAEKNLNKMGLHTLADIKSAQIYSKKALVEYIADSKK